MATQEQYIKAGLSAQETELMLTPISAWIGDKQVVSMALRAKEKYRSFIEQANKEYVSHAT